MNSNWDNVRFFKQSEFETPELMSPKLIYALDALRAKGGAQLDAHSS